MVTQISELQGAMIVWFVMTGASVVFVLADSIMNGVTSWVQRVAWILVTLYTGPIGLFFYFLTCRRPFPGGHARYTSSVWKQGLNSEIHCLAGDATGIMAAAAIVPLLGLSNGWDVVIEYLAGFIVGLFIFQALMMVGMYNGNYILAVRKTFFAETTSMNLVMTGMIPMMVLLADLWPSSHSPANPEFWFRMSLATIFGGILAYPINYWLVKNHLKHGCMTLPGRDGPAPNLGHCSPEGFSDHLVGGHVHHSHQGGINKDRQSSTHHEHASAKSTMNMNELPAMRAALIIFITFIILFFAMWFVSKYAPISFSIESME